MRRTLSSALALTLAAGLLTDFTPARIASAGSGDTQLVATLSGAPEPGGGDSNGSGTALVTLTRRKICFDITVQNIALPATTVHIHHDTTTENAIVVARLTPVPDDSGHAEGCVRAASFKIRDVRDHPSIHHLNVHNAEFPNGAIGGQLAPKS